jgi:hypothetical protein
VEIFEVLSITVTEDLDEVLDLFERTAQSLRST